ncbi:MAG: SGNH/GDSL hydrolase family protein [Proteobacteria bacterium]|nr:SGNH/GDSL hydrolase family protein [Pseudomonadota bacterium]
MALMLVSVEMVFYNFITPSDGFNFTLSSKLWMKKHWKPINSQGFRDVEYDPSSDAKKVFVVGDSFVAGYGIEDYRDRFANVLGRKLSSDWEMVIIANNGWNTDEQYNALVSHPAKPDFIVLSYFINDIEGAVNQSGIPRPPLFEQPTWFIRYVINNSYALNYLYWRVYRFASSQDMRVKYMDYLYQAYDNLDAWTLHKAQLSKFVGYARQHKINLVTVIFPNLTDISGSAIFTTKVADYMKSRGVTVIDMAEKLAGREPSSLIVNLFDAHPNVALNREIGELLYQAVMSSQSF